MLKSQCRRSKDQIS